MNFKLVALITLIGVGLTVRGDCRDTADGVCNDGRIEIVTTKNVTPQECAQELIDMNSSWDARHAFNRLSLEDRKEVRKALQEKLLLWVAEHGSIDTLKAQKQRQSMHPADAFFPAFISGSVSLGATAAIFGNVFEPENQIEVGDFAGIFKYLDMTTSNQKLAIIALASAATTVVGLCYWQNVVNQRKVENENNDALDNKISKLRDIQNLLEYCA